MGGARIGLNANADESVLPHGLFVSAGHRSPHLADRHISYARLARGASDRRVEIIRRVAPPPSVIVLRLILQRRSAAYINTAIGRPVFVSLFSFLVGKTGNPEYAHSHRARLRRDVDTGRARGRPS